MPFEFRNQSGLRPGFQQPDSAYTPDRTFVCTDRAGRFRSLGDGHVDFAAIFSKFAQYDFDGWAVLEWECCLKHPEDGAREGAAFIAEHIIRVTDKAFDDFAGTDIDDAANRKLLGLEADGL